MSSSDPASVPPRTPLRVGELAGATGLTVRTLHYYEEIGLLVPSTRTAAGHRLYESHDVERLYRIRLLRNLGLPLDDVAKSLDRPDWSFEDGLRSHLREVEQTIARASQMRTQLAAVVASVEASELTDPTDLMSVLENMTMNPAIRNRISILVYSDLPAAHEYLVRVFGFTAGELTRDPDGNCVHAEVQAGDGTIWLHPEAPSFQLASPKTLGAATATMAIFVDDVDAHYRSAVEQGATIRYEPVDQPYGFREYSASDPEGVLWSFMKPLD